MVLIAWRAWGDQAPNPWELQAAIATLHAAMDPVIGVAAASEKLRPVLAASLQGVDPRKVSPKDGAVWAFLFREAGRPAEARDLCASFVSTKPAAKAAFQARILQMNCCLDAGDAAGLEVALAATEAPSFNDCLTVAYTVTNYFVPSVQKSAGSDAAVGLLETARGKLSKFSTDQVEDEFAKPAQAKAAQLKEDRGSAISSRDSAQQARDGALLYLTQKEADIYKTSGRVDRAEAAFDALDGLLDSASPMRSYLKTAKAATILPGLAAPALQQVRTVGAFAGLASLKGKVVILDFFGSFCKPCEAEISELKQMYARDHARGLEIVSVTRFFGSFGTHSHLSEEQEYRFDRDYWKELQIPWAIDVGSARDWDTYGVWTIPEAVLIDRDGLVKSLDIGYSPDEFKAFRTGAEALLIAGGSRASRLTEPAGSSRELKRG